MPPRRKKAPARRGASKKAPAGSTRNVATGGWRGQAPARYLAEPAFLARAKELFWQNQGVEADEYERLIYDLAPPAPGPLLQAMAAFRGGDVPSTLRDPQVVERIGRLLRVIRYPQTEPVMELKDVQGLDLRQVSQILHFHHPAYPILSEKLVRGLNKLGIPAVYREDFSEDALADYDGVIIAMERIKERITFENVPESNCFLTRVIEGALVQYARERP